MNSKVGLSKIEALVNFTTQQRYQLPEHRKSVSGDMATRLSDDYFLGQPRPFRLWLADLTFLYSLASIERAHKML